MDNLTICSGLTFTDYAKKYCNYETNPRASRLLMIGRHYGKKHVEDIKSKMETYVFPDKEFSTKTLSDITRGDILDLMQRLSRKHSDKIPTVNKIMKHIASIFSEGFLRGDIKYNPAIQLASIKHTPTEKGYFTAEEITSLFADPDKWPSLLVYQVFMFAAFTGRRASEILVLEWEQFDGIFCDIDRAWKKAEKKTGETKWGITVKIPLAERLVSSLPKKGSCRYVFNENGKRHGETWWRRNFIKAMEGLGIDIKARNITPHSFRHSLNTNLLLAGCSEFYVKKYLGWTDKNRDTQALYTHIKPENLVIVADKIDEIYSGNSNVVRFEKNA